MMHLARGEFHAFKGGEADYLYLVPSAAVVKLDDATQAVLDVLGDGEHRAADVATRLAPRFSAEDIRSAITELLTVRAIRSVTPAAAAPPPPATVVAVDSAAAIGMRDVFVAGTSLRPGLAVYDKIDRMRVLPRHGMARVGGGAFPKQYVQFEAVAFHDGLDRRAETGDDLDLGPVPVTWALEEYAVTFDDDDIKFIGSIDQRGLFTPALDGPNPARSGDRNNVGDVWVVATYKPTGPGAQPMKARSLLVSTVPLYMRWEPWRVDAVTSASPNGRPR